MYNCIHDIHCILFSYMSQSEGGEYPLPALFCKVTSHYVCVFVFWKDIVYFVSPRMTMLIKDTSNITGTDWASNIQIKTLFGFILSCLSDILSLFTSSLYIYMSCWVQLQCPAKFQIMDWLQILCLEVRWQKLFSSDDRILHASLHSGWRTYSLGDIIWQVFAIFIISIFVFMAIMISLRFMAVICPLRTRVTQRKARQSLF